MIDVTKTPDTMKAKDAKLRRRLLKNAREEKQRLIVLLEDAAQYLEDSTELPMFERFGLCFAIAQVDTEERPLRRERGYTVAKRWMRDLYCEVSEHTFWWDDPTSCRTRRESDKVTEQRIIAILFAIEYLKDINSVKFLLWRNHYIGGVVP